jgi:hypothetical protein
MAASVEMDRAGYRVALGHIVAYKQALTYINYLLGSPGTLPPHEVRSGQASSKELLVQIVLYIELHSRNGIMSAFP